MILRLYLFLLLVILVVLVGCGGSEPSPTPAATPTSTPVPSPTNSPTPTPVATPTSTPTPTPSPSPTPTSTPVPIATTASSAEAAPLIHFPRDEAPHDVPIEWWYFNGHLADPSGLRYSFHFVGFQGLSPQGVEGRVMHLALATSDEDGVVKAERVALGRGERPARGFAISVGDWSIEGAGGRYSLKAVEGEYALSLNLEETKAPVLHGEDGIVGMSPLSESYYYSRTRLKVQGTLTVTGITRQVSGEAWMDQQWGNFAQERVGWDWFSLQLDDNTEVMLSLLFDPTTGEPARRYGTYVLPNGSAQYLQWEDIEVTPLSSWTSPRTGVTYPMGWRLQVIPLSLSLKVEPVHLDAEFDVSKIGAPVYWEGEVTFSGQRGEKPVGGRGFVELVGYD